MPLWRINILASCAHYRTFEVKFGLASCGERRRNHRHVKFIDSENFEDGFVRGLLETTNSIVRKRNIPFPVATFAARGTSRLHAFVNSSLRARSLLVNDKSNDINIVFDMRLNLRNIISEEILTLATWIHAVSVARCDFPRFFPILIIYALSYFASRIIYDVSVWSPNIWMPINSEERALSPSKSFPSFHHRSSMSTACASTSFIPTKNRHF